MKSGELVKRAEKRAEAEKELAQAQEQGTHVTTLVQSLFCMIQLPNACDNLVHNVIETSYQWSH